PASLLPRRWPFPAAPRPARFVAVLLLSGLPFAVPVGLPPLCLALLPSRAWALPVAFVLAPGPAPVLPFLVPRAVLFRLRCAGPGRLGRV
ncbi:hypothetical protein C3R44_23360, partial [Mycobacterium tuberculosis]